MAIDAEVLRRSLLDFFDTRARDLPWRRTDDPYAVWVSEVMLQQTRVETVLPYYEEWLQRFPDVDALADAEADEVLKAWEGLGYYRRARFLHRAAAVVRERHAGRLPDSVDELRELPGVGDYTAGAVASIAFGEVVPAVDGNARRVLARLFDLPEPSPTRLRSLAGSLVDRERPGDFNQALMELGATVCTPRAPECASCPVRTQCLARVRGTVAERPAPGGRRKVRNVELGVAVLVDAAGRVLLRRRPEEGLLGGMWECPSREVREGESPEEAARAAAEGALGAPGRLPASTSGGEPLDPVSHAFTHIRASYRPFLFRLPRGGEEGEGPEAGVRWATRDQRASLPLPVAQRTILRAALK